MGPKPIPFSEIVTYSEWLGITCPVEKARLIKVVMTMDNRARELIKAKAGK